MRQIIVRHCEGSDTFRGFDENVKDAKYILVYYYEDVPQMFALDDPDNLDDVHRYLEQFYGDGCYKVIGVFTRPTIINERLFSIPAGAL